MENVAQRTIKEMQTLFLRSGVGFRNQAYAVQLAKSELAPEWECNCVAVVLHTD